ncbi:MAG: hypothetical protein CMO01_14485, partial [Thalassobius sp.]|nr:hypothetical protein [Thalassovita sp.]
ATNHFNYADIAYLSGNLQTARTKLEQCMHIYQQLGLTNSTEYAQCYGNLGLIDAAEKNWKEGEKMFQLALDIISLDKESAKTSDSFKMVPNALWVINEYMNFLYRKYEDLKEAKILNEFNHYAEIYLDMSDKFRKQFNDAYTKSVLIKDNAEVYDRNIGIYNKLYAQTSEQTYLKAAYNFSEYGRTSLLRDIQDSKINTYAGVPDSVLQKEATLQQQINILNQELLNKPDDVQTKKDLLASKEALNKYIEELKYNYPKYHELKFNSSIHSIEEIQSFITKEENLIEFMQDDTAYYALIVKADFTDLKHLGNRNLINQLVSEWKNALVTRNDAEVLEKGYALYQKLWQPFEAELTGKHITLIPTGPLFYLNFETFSSNLSANTYLIYKYNISYALSFNVLFSEHQTTTQNTLLTVTPGFEEEIKQQYQNQLDTIENPDREFLQTVRQPWSLKLANSLKDEYVNEAFIGSEATEANIKSNIQHGNILYFGTHAIADADDPLRSKLVLAKEIGNQKEDGYLHAYELFGLPLQAELAILNACESGLGNLQKGEGMISLAYSIHYAGCPSTMMSLWKVDEKTNTQITSMMLTYLSRGLSKSEALRHAKLDYLKSAGTELKNPFYWGGMVLMGNDGKVQLESKTPWWTSLIVVGFIILIILYYFILKKKNKALTIANRQNMSY